MTIVVGVAAPDGMILAADSRTTYMVGERHRIASDNAQKVFPICDTIGVATYGDAGIGGRTIAGLMDEFVSTLDEGEPRDAAAIAAALGAFFDERYRAEAPPELVAELEAAQAAPVGFLVAGYDDDGIGRIREVAVPGPRVEDETEITTAVRGVVWRGQTDVIRRMVYGFDADLFLQAGHDMPEAIVEPLQSLAYELLFPITMQDAVDLAAFLISTTVGMQRFSDGTHARPGELPGCGGPVRVLSVTRDGVRWVTDNSLVVDSGSAPLGEGGFRR